MYFGTRDEFEYLECSNCGCLQIKDVPENLSKYYPENYYSLSRPKQKRQPRLLTFLKRQRLRHYLGEKSTPGRLFTKIAGEPHFRPWVRKTQLRSDYAILDVGSGVGSRLLYLEKKGFRYLTGIDPFVEEDIRYDNGVRVFKKKAQAMEGQFDFIMLHHTFEHMPDPLPTLQHLHRLLKPKRFLLLRLPVTSSYAWERYQTNWVQLDAPRHFFLHSQMSIRILADQVGFRIEDMVCDSTIFQFWGSEQYARDIPLVDERSYGRDPGRSIFTEADIREFERKTEELNNENRGDQACFYLYKA
jgi:SAM-dependent methyltransferase